LDPNNLDDWILYGRSLIQSFEYDIVHRKAEDLQRQGFLEQLHQNLKVFLKNHNNKKNFLIYNNKI